MEKTIEPLSKVQLRQLIEFIHSDKSEPMDIIFELMLVTGMRSHEMWDLNVEDFNGETKEVSIVRPAKGSLTGCYDLSAMDLYTRAARLINEKRIVVQPWDKFIYIFTQQRPAAIPAKLWMRRRWIEIRHKLWGDACRLGLHCLRHTFAQNCRDIMPIEQVQIQLRHKSIASTLRYMSRPTKQMNLIVHREDTARLYKFDDE